MVFLWAVFFYFIDQNVMDTFPGHRVDLHSILRYLLTLTVCDSCAYPSPDAKRATKNQTAYYFIVKVDMFNIYILNRNCGLPNSDWICSMGEKL